ncbi:MAG: type 1 glutamine amidotransferase [Mycobacteriales bacterium]
MTGPSSLHLVVLYPELLGTYGDGGNAVVLERRMAWRGLPYETTRVALGEAVPAQGDLYVLGGGEDRAQLAALRELEGSPLVSSIEAGAQLFGVCAGLQLLGRSFSTGEASRREGLGLLDLTTDRLERRALGEIVAEPDPALGLPLLTGFENHGGRTVLGPTATPLARVRDGIGNGHGGVEGAYDERVLATYLHGPVLARNPDLADLLLTRVLGTPLEPIDLPVIDELRRERLARRG